MFKSKRNILILIACLILILGCALVFNARVQEWVGWHTAQALVWLKVQFDPPEEVAFTSPGDTTQNLPLPVITTPTSSAPDVPGTIQPEETILPAVTSVSLPDFVELDGITYFSQHNRWSYCGPANLAMALSYWGWEGTHDDVAHVVKPYPKDKSVMPYELVDYIQTETDRSAAAAVKTATRSAHRPEGNAMFSWLLPVNILPFSRRTAAPTLYFE